MNAFCSWLHREGYLADRYELQPLKVEKRLLQTLTLVCLLLDTGLRIEEGLTLRVEDLDSITCSSPPTAKGGKERRIPISSELRRAVSVCAGLNEAADADDAVVSDARGDAVGSAQQSAGLHIVRLSRVLGHTQITTTQRYLHLLTEDLSASHQRVSILNRLAMSGSHGLGRALPWNSANR